MHENEKSVQSGGSGYSKHSGLSKGSGLNGYSGLGNVAALLQPQTALEQIQEATGNYESRLESLADCQDEQEATEASIIDHQEPDGMAVAIDGGGRNREIHVLKRSSCNDGFTTVSKTNNTKLATIEQKLQ